MKSYKDFLVELFDNPYSTTPGSKLGEFSRKFKTKDGHVGGIRKMDKNKRKIQK